MPEYFATVRSDITVFHAESVITHESTEMRLERSGRRFTFSRQDFLQHSPFVGRPDEAVVQTLPGIAETIWVKTEDVLNGGLQVSNAHRVLHRVVAELVGCAKRETAFHAA